MNVLKKILSLRPELTLGGSAHVRIDNPPFMALYIEAIGVGPRGLPAISVAHYGEQNGDLMRDPEMCFEMELNGVVVTRLHPYYFRNDYVGVEEFSVQCYGCDNHHHRLIHTDARMVASQEAFATLWDTNIGDQGFVERLRENTLASTK
jgi:hypothetical protein